MEIRPSRVLLKLRAGELVSCTKINLSDSRAIEIAALSGIDCVWPDMEHVPNDYSVIEKNVLAAKAYNTDIMVRVSKGCYSDYIKPLEMDATGIMVPHVMSLDEAKNIVRMTRFHPIGRRPLDGGNADGAYCNIGIRDYIRQANERRFICIQIEDPEPLDQLDEIAQLDGIDMLFFGPADFSHAIGVPGQSNDPQVVKARKMVAETAIRHGKFAGTVGSAAKLNELVDMGYRFISMGADVVGLSKYFSGIVSSFKELSI